MQSEQTITNPNPWARYRPSAETPWNRRRVVHLHRRAGFAATADEIERDLNDGPEASVDRFLQSLSRMRGVPADFEQIAVILADAAVASRDISRLKAAWLYRMLFSPDPLAERLTLLWHNHFATSNLKVDEPGTMRRQNDIFRECGRGPFGELLRRVVHDPALLVFLDAPANRKEHPNENLARELMELFSLGVGNFSEADVKEAARALTGWTVSQSGEFREVAERHDDSEKTILGRTGKWRGDDLVEMLLEHPATATRLAKRLCEMFLGEDAVATATRPPRPPLPKGGSDVGSPVQELAAGLREHSLDIGWGVETILRSELFFSEANLGRRIVGPAEFVVGAVRMLEQFDPPPGTLVLAEWVARLGQDLFYPPNVFGWPGDRSWITPRSMVGRTNFATAIVRGSLGGRTEPLDVFALLHKHGRNGTLDDTISFCGDVILGGPLSGSLQEQLKMLRELAKGNDADTARRIVAMVLASPEAQVA
jgi:uncharacterized protein (DUF1800 family)